MIFLEALRYVFVGGESVTGGLEVGGSNLLPLIGNHLLVSATAVGAAIALAVPLGLWLGHVGRAQFLSVSVSNVGRAIPPLALVFFFIAFVGIGFANIAMALTLLAIPPVLTNTYVGTRAVDPDTVDAARGMGLSEGRIATRVELPLALPTIAGGVKIAAVNVMATAIVAPYADWQTLGIPIINFNVHGEAGQLAAAIVTAVLTLGVYAALGAVQRAVTPAGLKVAAGSRPRGRLLPASGRKVQTT